MLLQRVSSGSEVSRTCLLLSQHELRFGRAALTNCARERDKLRADLAEANSRAFRLAAEVDEQNARAETNAAMKTR